MNKNLTWKIVLAIVLVVVAAWTLYPPNETLKPGIDLAGGTSLIYEIDAQGLIAAERKELSTKMITVLRRRIDPANIQNLIWRPQGATRFEIQMPLASAEARKKRQNFEKALSELLAENIRAAVIMRSLQKTNEQRSEDFKNFARGSSDRLTILEELAAAHDERKAARDKRDEFLSELQAKEEAISSAEIDLDKVNQNISQWLKLDEQQLTESLSDFLGSVDNLALRQESIGLLTGYIKEYAKWADVAEKLTEPETGKNIQYKNAKKALDKLSLTRDQINTAIGTPPKSVERKQIIDELKKEFSERAEKIDIIVEASDEYRPFKGRLDDPRDLQRMLKGAGILEFRIIPTTNPDTNPKFDIEELSAYVDSLKTKGPKFASDSKHIWFEIENTTQEELTGWIRATEAVIGQFGEKYYVLASNQQDEIVVHGTGENDWKLTKARPSTDQMGRRAISFTLDERGGRLFGNVTGKNIGRPLCILLDGLAISAPNIQTKITTDGQITGSFSQEEVEDMISKLNAGSLPAMLIEQPISIKTIGPSIGADNRDKGIEAGIIGFIVVVFCMLIYYMLAGSIADVALFMNLLFVLAIMALVRATFTLPGIAGMILTIGMSVDANVLIFERIREEQQRGSSLGIAIKNGYERALRTILDANITTFITAAILFWVASEEIKGFAIVLMLGIASSMFTALFVTRIVFDWLLAKRIIKDHLFMLRLIHKPNVNWMALRPVFLTISTLLIAAGLFVFFTRDPAVNNKYDIEFTGGTSVQINLKENVNLSRQDVEDRIHKAAIDLNNPALAAAKVYSIGKSNRQYEINTTETNKTTVTVTFGESQQQSPEEMALAIKKAQGRFEGKLSNLRIIQKSNPADFVIETSNTNKSLVKGVLETAFPDAQISQPKVDEVVNNTILNAFADELQIQQNLLPEITSEEKITEELIDSFPELVDFLGGIRITCELERGTTAEDIDSRFKALRFKPDTQNLNYYPYQILDTTLNQMQPDKPVNTFVYLSAPPEAGLRELTENEWTQFIENETTKITAAATLATSLPRVTQINPSVGAEQKTRALIAIVLSLFAIVTYVGFRFGDLKYGIAAIVALVHDVCITLGAVTACTYIAETTIGTSLLIGDFKINLAMIAAFLTLIGYSLNDTIVVFDRIRENRHKAFLNPQIITNSINQTISRTLLTSFTTFIVVLIMYVFGGQGLRGFTFAIGLGIIVGTYSSIAIAAPILLFGTGSKNAKGKK